MSALTKEEEEFIDHLGRMDANYYICPERSHILKLITIIDRLSARCEELERENKGYKERLAQITEKE